MISDGSRRRRDEVFLKERTVRSLDRRLWPVRPPPQPDELLSSWIVRLASANGVKLHSFCAHVFPGVAVWNRDIDRSAPATLLATLSTRTGVVPSRVFATTLRSYEGRAFSRVVPNGNTPWLLALGVFHRVRRQHGLQFCRRCLATDVEPYFRRRWRLGFIVCCDVHRCALEDRCPVCAGPVQLHRGDLGVRARHSTHGITICCDCGADLREGGPRAPSALRRGEVRLSRRLTEALDTGMIRWPTLRRLPLPSYLIVLRQLARLLLGGSRGAPLRRAASSLGSDLAFSERRELRTVVMERVDVERRRAALLGAARLLERWPIGFVRLCRAYRVWSTPLLADLSAPPAWYEDVIDAQLYLPLAQ